MKITDAIYYDPASGALFYSRHSGNRKKGDKAGTVCTVSQKAKEIKYLKVFINGKSVFAHRAIMEGTGHDLAGKLVDHINGDTLDNRIENLRVVSAKDNNKNSAFNPRSKTGINGVYISFGRFYARITVDKKNIHLGVFGTIFDAACARKSALIRHEFHENHGRP
jgi:hypothetical protein